MFKKVTFIIVLITQVGLNLPSIAAETNKAPLAKDSENLLGGRTSADYLQCHSRKQGSDI